MVNASIHRQGTVFPAYAFNHQIETEGFAQMVKRLGGKLIGLPKYHVLHGTSSFPICEQLGMCVDGCDLFVLQVSMGESPAGTCYIIYI